MIGRRMLGGHNMPTHQDLRGLAIVAVDVRFEDDQERWIVEFVKPPLGPPPFPKQTRYVCH